MSELAIGIDLGTSNSCVSVVRNGKVEVLANQYGEMTTASVVAFHADGMIEVGNRARANIVHDPMNTICSAKRLIGRYFFSEEVKKAQAVCAYEIVEGPQHGVRCMAREEEFSLPEISAMVLREMKQIAEVQLGQPISKAVITVPAYFNDNQRQATKDAGKIAGLEVLRILNEPTAAALAYGFGRELNQRVAVYDLGGGTFDVSVLEIGRDIFEVLSTCGDTFLGGDDFDDRLIDLLADEFVAREGINLRLDPYAFEKIKVAAESAKRTLSVEDTVEIRIPDIVAGKDGAPRSIERMLTREEYAALVHDLVMRTFKVCDEAMQQADLTTRDLDGVILVGGPTRLPMIRKAVTDYFQQELKDEVDPDQVVAKGAAIHAASLCGGDVIGSGHDAFLLDVTPLDLRIGVAGGLAEPVIERNTPVPIEQTRRFTTTRDSQDSVKIRVFQGGERYSADNEMLGEFEFSGFEVTRRGDVKIDVTFEINADGIVNVTAFDPDTGQKASTRISLSSGLSGTELDAIIEGDKTSRVQAPAALAAAAAAPASDPAPLAALDEIAPAYEPHLASPPALEREEPDLEVDLAEMDGAQDELEIDEAPPTFGAADNVVEFGTDSLEVAAPPELETDESELEPELETDEPVLEADEPALKIDAAPVAAALAESLESAPAPVVATVPEVASLESFDALETGDDIPLDSNLGMASPDTEISFDELEELDENLEIELDSVAAAQTSIPIDEALGIGVELEAAEDLDIEINDEELLELADVVRPTNDDAANAYAVTDVHVVSSAEAAAERDAFDEYSSDIEIDPSAKENLFDTSNVDLSADHKGND